MLGCIQIISYASSYQPPELLCELKEIKDNKCGDMFDKIKYEIEDVFKKVGEGYDAISKSKVMIISNNVNYYRLKVMKAGTECDLVANINEYIGDEKRCRKSEKCKLFINEIKERIISENSILNKFYFLQNNKGYKLCLSESGVENDKIKVINRINKMIEDAGNELIALKDLHRITYSLVSMYNSELFRTETLVNDDEFKNVISEGVVMHSDELDRLKLKLEKLNNKNRVYIGKINLNMDSLPSTLNGLEDYENKIIPNVLEMIKPAIVELCCPQENFWARLANVISAFLFPKIFKEKQDKKTQLENTLSELNRLITELSKKTNYDNVMNAPWLYKLVSHLLVKGTPTQYPFDLLNVFSPDRKVWLELQKEWLKPLEPKFKPDKPKISS